MIIGLEIGVQNKSKQRTVFHVERSTATEAVKHADGSRRQFISRRKVHDLTLTYRAKNWKKKTQYQLLLMKASDRGRNVKRKELFGCFDEIFISMQHTCSVHPA